MATVLGNIIADIYYVYAVMKKSKRLTCSPSHMKVTGRRIRDILMIGIPASITNIMQTFMMVMTNNFLLTYWAISRFKNRNSPNDGLPAKRRNIFRSWKQI